MNLDFVDTKKTKQDKNGIWITDLILDNDVKLSKEAWEKIYDYELKDLVEDKKDFIRNKLKYHIAYLCKDFTFNKKTIYLEIGSGPAHIGEYIMHKYNSHFIGVDFNYKILLTLKNYFEKVGYTNFTLIHADINNMPLKNNSIDYIYGGGVIEHFSNTQSIINTSFNLLKNEGVVFNTVPAFNLWWLTRFYNNIPSLKTIKSIFEFLHIKLFKGKILNRYYGYELSYLVSQLKKLHINAGFKKITVSSFAFYPSKKVLKNNFLREVYYFISNNIITAPVYYVKAKK